MVTQYLENKKNNKLSVNFIKNCNYFFCVYF